MGILKSVGIVAGMTVGIVGLLMGAGALLGGATEAAAQGPEHCLSSGYGEHRALSAAVRQALTHPDSFEYVGLRLGKDLVGGQAVALMTFKHDTPMGGTVQRKVMAHFDPTTCALGEWHLS